MLVMDWDGEWDLGEGDLKKMRCLGGWMRVVCRRCGGCDVLVFVVVDDGSSLSSERRLLILFIQV
jgi:hypothetical protein